MAALSRLRVIELRLQNSLSRLLLICKHRRLGGETMECLFRSSNYPFPTIPMKTCHLFSRNFDAHRVTAYNIDPALLQTFTSPKELETLSYQDVLKSGDDLATIESRTYANQEEQVNISSQDCDHSRPQCECP